MSAFRVQVAYTIAKKKILIALLKFPVYLAMNEEHGGSKVNARGRERCHMSWHSPFASLAQCEAAPDTLRSYRVLPELRKQILPILFLTFTLIYAALLKFLVHEQNLSSMKAHLHPQKTVTKISLPPAFQIPSS